MKTLSTFTIIRLILLTLILSLFFACSSSANKESELQGTGALQEEEFTTGNPAYWAIPAQYKNVPIEQIKSQIEITDYMTIKGARTRAGSDLVEEEGEKGKADKAALAAYTNKTISLEGVISVKGTQKTAPIEIIERESGKYEIWFCDKTRKPCRYQAFLLYIGPEGKGDTLFTKENVIRFWGVILGEEIRAMDNVTYSQPRYKRFPKIRVLDLEIIK